MTRRWLVLAADAPPTVEGRSYGERLATALAGRGHDVVIARRRRSRAFSSPEGGAGGPRIAELDTGPLPSAPTPANRTLIHAASMHARVAQLLRDRGPFDALLAEGAFGALVMAPQSERLGVPWVLALPDCEVARRRNRLTREQLYWAELEQWGCERAAGVVVPRQELRGPLATHYRHERARVVPAPRPQLVRSESDVDILARLSLHEPPDVILAPDDANAAVGARVAEEGERAVVVLGAGTFVHRAGLPVQVIGRQPARGPALAALLSRARAVAALEGGDARVDEAIVLGCRVAVAATDDERDDPRPVLDRASAPPRSLEWPSAIQLLEAFALEAEGARS